jgi:hypothetical protein
MRMIHILGGVASSAVIVAMAVVYLTADEAKAAVDPKETVYIDRIVEVEVERVIHVPMPPQPRAQTVIEAVSDEDRKCLAKNIYFEARGESQVGQAAVAWVTLNRVAASEFPTNICAVVWQSSQFSWTHDGKSDRPRDPAAWATAQAIAREVVEAYGVDRDPTEGATYFHATTVKPKWAKQFERVVQIDNHIFFLDRLHEFVGVGPAAKRADILLPVKITLVIVPASRRRCFCVHLSVLPKLKIPRQ